MSKRWSSNERGLTLVEVLAALVILGILFVGIMTIFPQMTLFNEKTEAKLDTMNLARQEMAAITEQAKWEKIIELNPANPLTNVPDYLDEPRIKEEMVKLGYSESTSLHPEEIIRFEKADDYFYEVDIYKECETFLNQPDSAASCEVTERNKLYKVHVKILDENIKGSGNYVWNSETFSYLTYKAVNELPSDSGGN